MKPHRALIALAGMIVLAACGGSTEDGPAISEPGPGEQPLRVAVVNYPLAYFAERIGGADVEILFPVPADEDPAYWSPEPETIASYQAADLILLSGADYAKWVAQASLPAARLVDTSSGYTDQLIPLAEAVTHAHGPEGEHAHGGLAFTTWLDPTLALEQARATAAALEKARPQQAAAFGEGLASLEADLIALDQRLEAVAAVIGDRPLVFSHPVYQYLERRHGLNGRSVHWEPDAEPSEKEWRELERLLGDHPARWMIWEGEPLAPVSARLEKMGVTAVVFEPCANLPGEGDFLSVMRGNLDRLAAAAATAAF